MPSASAKFFIVTRFKLCDTRGMAQQWITRQKTGKGYRYFQNGVPVTGRDSLKYLKSLRIPPAWRDVRRTVETMESKDGAYLSQEERCVLKLLETAK